MPQTSTLQTDHSNNLNLTVQDMLSDEEYFQVSDENIKLNDNVFTKYTQI